MARLLATLPVVEPLYSWCISQGLALWCAGTGSDSDLHFAMLVYIRANLKITDQAPVVQRFDIAIHFINHHLLDKC